MSILKQLKDKELFSAAEQEIVNFIATHPKKVTGMTVEELATATYSSPSTIVRLCRKLKTKGYADFKIKLAMDLNEFDTAQERVDIDMPVNKDATTEDIANKLMNLHHQALKETYATLDIAALQRAADAIYKADVISIFGVGNSLIIAEELHYKIRNLGIPVVTNPLIGFEGSQVNPGKLRQVAIVISKFANSRRVIQWIRNLKDENYEVILITANLKGPLIKLVDHPILIENDEKRWQKLGAFSSRTSMLYLTDCLFLMVFMKDYDNNLKTIHRLAMRSKESSEYDGPNS